MFRYLRFIALIVSVLATHGPAAAQTTPAPPDWKDNGSSVYLAGGEKRPAANDSSPPISSVAIQTEQVTTTRKFDSSVVPSAHVEQAVPADSSSRHLAPPGTLSARENPVGSASPTNAELRRPMDFGVPTKSLYTMGTGLAIAVGAFLLFAWVL